MLKDRLSILLSASTKLVANEAIQDVTHMQIKKNDITKRYELRFYNKSKLIVLKQYHNMTINVISNESNRFTIHITEGGKANSLELIFENEENVLRIKKYVDTLLI